MQSIDLAVGNLVSALIDGSASAVAMARQCLTPELSNDAVVQALLTVERAMIASIADGRASATSSAMADRLRVALDVLAPSIPVALTDATVAQEDEEIATIALVSLPGDAHDVGRVLWHVLLEAQGYDVCDLGLLAPAVVGRHLAELKPDAVGVYVFDVRGQPAVQSLVVHLLRRKLQVPVLLSGPGVDEAFARWVSVPGGGEHYWAGVYYCEDVPEAVQVLQQIVLYEPPPQTHTHDHGVPDVADSCASCDECALVDVCEMPEAAGT